MQVLENQPLTCFPFDSKTQMVQDTSDMFISYIKGLQTSKLWTLRRQGHNFLAHQMILNNKIIVRATVFIELPFDTAFKFFSDPFYSRHLTRVIGSCTVLQQSGDLKVIQMVMDLLPPVTNRQMVAVHTIKHEGDKCYIGCRSCPDYPFQKHKGTILAFINGSGFILQPVSQKRTKMTMMTDYESGGSIPYFLKRWIAFKKIQYLKNVEKKIRQIYNIK